MKRKKTKKKNLNLKAAKAMRQLRKMLGRSQPLFGNLIGLTKRGVQGLEKPTYDFSERIAAQISWRTGVSAAWLLQGELRSLGSHEPYTPDTFKQWDEREALDEVQINEIVLWHSKCLEIFLRQTKGAKALAIANYSRVFILDEAELYLHPSLLPEAPASLGDPDAVFATLNKR
jgi:hypothetical protein